MSRSANRFDCTRRSFVGMKYSDDLAMLIEVAFISGRPKRNPARLAQGTERADRRWRPNLAR